MMMVAMKKSIFAAALGCLLFPAIGIAATMEEIDQRLKKLEGDVGVNREETDDIASRLKNSLSVSGYADAEYVTTNKSGPNYSGFRLHHLSMFLKKQVSDDLRFFSETEWEDAPYASADAAGLTTGTIFVEALNFDYQWRPDTSMRVGRFFTPAGIWSVDHYPPFVLTQQRPQHIREIFPQLVDGAAVSGQHAAGNSFVSYDLYVGNGETATFDGNGDQNTTKAAGLRANVALPIAQQFDVGATFYHDKLAASADPLKESKKDVYGAHAKIRQGAFGLQAEYADGKYQPTVSPATNLPYHKKGYYAQFSYAINKWTLGYRYDFFDSKTTSVLSSATKINSAIVNYHVNKNVVMKLEHHLVNVIDPAQKDYYRNIVSIAVNLD